MADLKYYDEAKNDAQLEEWLKRPYDPNRLLKDGVPENLLPAIKASFLCYSQFNRDELMKSLEKRTVPESARRDPTIDNFTALMKEIATKAKDNPDKDYLIL